MARGGGVNLDFSVEHIVAGVLNGPGVYRLGRVCEVEMVRICISSIDAYWGIVVVEL